jgi:hypothetical protein
MMNKPAVFVVKTKILYGEPDLNDISLEFATTVVLYSPVHYSLSACTSEHCILKSDWNEQT